VVTDFDEQVAHFRFAPFSLEKVMGFKLAGAEIAQVANMIGMDTNGILRHQSTIHQEVYMDAKYKITGGQVGAVGDNARAENFTQIWSNASGKIDLDELANELATLRAAARQEATSAEQDEALGAIASAESAARKGDGAGAFEQLAKAGKWALDVATKIGVSVAAVALTHALGLK
jgi:hypothetical protein